MAPFAKIRAFVDEHGGALLTRSAALFGLILLFFVAFGGVSHHARWHIDTVKISGATIVSDDSLRSFVNDTISGNYFLVYARDNSLIFPKAEIEQSVILKFPRIESAVVHKVDDHTIELVVTERKPYVLWCGEQFNAEAYELADCWFADRSGYIFDKAPVFSTGVYLELFAPLDTQNTDNPVGLNIPAARFTNTDSLVQALESSVSKPFRVIMLENSEYEFVMKSNLTYPMLEKVTLKLKDGIAPATVVKNLKAALAEEFPLGVSLSKKLLYIDLRFGNKIFFGFENN